MRSARTVLTVLMEEDYILEVTYGGCECIFQTGIKLVDLWGCGSNMDGCIGFMECLCELTECGVNGFKGGIPFLIGE